MTAFSVLLVAATLATTDMPTDFDTEIMPILTKSGCNVGSCHGSAKGRGGFKLSLYGSDATADFFAIVKQHEGRRINRIAPNASLVLLKPTESLEHGGGHRLEDDGPSANRLASWIAEGALRVKRRELIGFEVRPNSFVGEHVGDTVPLHSLAKFDDGTTADATQWTVFRAEDDAAVQIDEESGIATVLRRGRHVVIARYLDRVAPLELIVPMSGTTPDLSHAARYNFIDDEVLETLATLRLPISPQAGQRLFLRRVYLDLTGRLPLPGEIREFLGDERPDRRNQLIDQLLESDSHADYWTYRMARLLRIRPTGRGKGRDTAGADAYYTWLRSGVARNMPYDRMARTLITAEGDSHEVGPANFYRTVSGARDQAEFMSELFMGSRLRCANCHNHPLDRWTQDDYHGFAAVFARIEPNRFVKTGTRGKVIHPRTGEAAVPRIPGERFLNVDIDGRHEFADWLTSEDNLYFAKASVNRLWKALMGRGLVEPSDDMRQTNPATHPRLLKRLADDFVRHGFDLRRTIRLIARSAAYQRAPSGVPGNEGDDRFYARALVRPMEAEVLADALSDVTGVWDVYGELPTGTRAIQLYDPTISSKSLDVLGRCLREESCEAPAGAVTGGLSRKLHVVNGPLLNRKVTSSSGRLHRLLAEGMTDDEIIGEFYLRGLTRVPSEQERRIWSQELSGASEADRREILEDFVWSLLSCREFVSR